MKKDDGYRIEAIRKQLLKKKEKPSKRSKKKQGSCLTWQSVLSSALNNKRSRLRELVTYLTVQGYNERYICKLLSIPYKSWRLYIMSDDILRSELNKARSMRVDYNREAKVVNL